jgi:hypothetical protein
VSDPSKHYLSAITHCLLGVKLDKRYAFLAAEEKVLNTLLLFEPFSVLVIRLRLNFLLALFRILNLDDAVAHTLSSLPPNR